MRAAFLVPAAAAIAACSSASPMGPSGELNAVFAFAAYPRGTIVVTHANPTWVGPYQVPGRSGFQEYRVSDPPETVEAHYRDLAGRTGWSLTGGFGGSSGYGVWTLAREKREIRLTLGPTQGPVGGYQPAPIYATPAMPPPMPAVTPIGWSPPPTPEPTPTPAPTPSPSTWYLRIEANL